MLEIYAQSLDTLFTLYATPEAAFMILSLAVAYNLLVDIRMDKDKNLNDK